jgi:hypothetical protein
MIIGGVVRAITAAGGGWLISQGASVDDVNTMAGAAVTLGTIAWSIFAKRAPR